MIPENPPQTTSQSGATASQFEFIFDIENHPIFFDIEPNIVSNFFNDYRKDKTLYHLFRKYAYEARKRWAQFSGRDILAHIRWDEHFNAQDEFKANNSHVSVMVRMLILEDESFKDFFMRK